MRRGTTLLCFSPPVMIATIIIELGLAVWVLARYATGSVRRLILSLLILLAAFQLAEFNVCGSALPDLVWSRMGYVFITMLPALGLDLVVRIRGERRPALVWGGYILAVSFAAAFAFAPTALNRGVCTGNYVIFLLSQPLAALYGVYYFGLELAALGLALMPLRHARAQARAAAHWMAVGYALIIVPTLVIVVLLPAVNVGIPSVMCGFAVLYALVIGLRVAPLMVTRRANP